MSLVISQVIHIQCDKCGTWLRTASEGRYMSKAIALRHASKHGWSHGKRDLCPTCRPYRLSYTPVQPVSAQEKTS